MGAKVRFISWKAADIVGKVETILESYGDVIAEESSRQITTTKWNWDRATLRFTSLFQGGSNQRSAESGVYSPPTTAAGASNTRKFKKNTSSGKISTGLGVVIPKGPRDIVDTGELLNSQTPPVVGKIATGYSLEIKWTAPYSGLILKGGDFGTYVNVNGQIVSPGDRPGRDWISAALREQPLMPYLIKQWK